jgi:hypothetical protein
VLYLAHLRYFIVYFVVDRYVFHVVVKHEVYSRVLKYYFVYGLVKINIEFNRYPARHLSKSDWIMNEVGKIL